MIIKNIITVLLLSIAHSKASEFSSSTTGYRPPVVHHQPGSIIDFNPITFEIIKHEIKAKTVPIIKQEIKEKKDNDQNKNRDCKLSEALIIRTIFNDRMNDALAKKICSLVAQKEAQPDFVAELTLMDDETTCYFPQTDLDSFTTYKHEHINDVPSIVCTTIIFNQDFLDEAIKAVERE